jgi:hypothetical protein
MERILIVCGTLVRGVANFGASILAQRPLPTQDGDGIDRQHEYGILVKLFVFAVVMGVLGAVGIGHVGPYGLR